MQVTVTNLDQPIQTAKCDWDNFTPKRGNTNSDRPTTDHDSPVLKPTTPCATSKPITTD